MPALDIYSAASTFSCHSGGGMWQGNLSAITQIYIGSGGTDSVNLTIVAPQYSGAGQATDLQGDAGSYVNFKAELS